MNNEVEQQPPLPATELERRPLAHAAHTPGPWLLNADAKRHELGFYGTPSEPGEEEVYTSIHIGDNLRLTAFIKPADARLIVSAPDLLAALKELLASVLTTMPPFEAGKGAQNAWADRRAKARNDAAAVVVKVEGSDPEESTHERAGVHTNGDPL